MSELDGDILGMETGGVADYATLVSTLRALAREPVYTTRSLAGAATVAAAHKTLRLLGYTAAGDGGGALLKRVDAEPLHTGKLRTQDRFLSDGTTDATHGGWWVHETRFVRPEQFGGRDAAAFAEAIAFCASERAVILLDPRATYTIDEEIVVDDEDITIMGLLPELTRVGGETTRATIQVTESGYHAFRVQRGGGNFRLLNVSATGRNLATNEIVGAGLVKVESRGGKETGITAANGVQVIGCEIAEWRGAPLRFERDSTEFRVEGCRIRRAGRTDGSLSGADRFLDGEIPGVYVEGNGSLVNCEIVGATSHCVHVYAGADDAFGVWEECQLRAVNVRAQNSFLSLLRVEDAGAARPVSCTWSQGYLENPGTITDSTTSGGSNITQGSADDVTAVWASGPAARVSLDAPAKVLNRRARAAFRATAGARIDVDLRGQMLAAQQLGNTSDVRTRFEADAGSLVLIRDPGELRGAATGAAIEPGVGGWTQLGLAAPFVGSGGLIHAHRRLLRTIVDGTSTDMIAPTAGYNSTTHAAVAGSGTGTTMPTTETLAGVGSVLKVVGRTSAASSTVIQHVVAMRADWIGHDLMAEAQVWYERDGAWTDGGVRLAMRVYDPAAIENTTRNYRDSGVQAANNTVTGAADILFPVYQQQPGLTVADPGASGVGPMHTAQAFFRPLAAGDIVVRVQLRSASTDAPFAAYWRLHLYATDPKSVIG